MWEACLAFLMVSLTGKRRRSVNASRCVKQEHICSINGRTTLPPQLPYKASPINRPFYIRFQMPFYARSKGQRVGDSFLFQYLVTVMMVRERKSQMMSGCHVTKVFSTTFKFRPHDSRRTPTVTPAEICTHSFSACLRLMGLNQTPHDSWALSPKQHTNMRF